MSVIVKSPVRHWRLLKLVAVFDISDVCVFLCVCIHAYVCMHQPRKDTLLCPRKWGNEMLFCCWFKLLLFFFYLFFFFSQHYFSCLCKQWSTAVGLEIIFFASEMTCGGINLNFLCHHIRRLLIITMIIIIIGPLLNSKMCFCTLHQVKKTRFHSAVVVIACCLLLYAPHVRWKRSKDPVLFRILCPTQLGDETDRCHLTSCLMSCCSQFHTAAAFTYSTVFCFFFFPEEKCCC